MVKISEKAHGVNRPKIIDSLNKLADFHKDKGDPKKALALYERMVKISEKAHGVNSLKVVDSLEKLADYHDLHGDLKEALALYDRIVTIAEKIHVGEFEINPARRITLSLNSLRDLPRDDANVKKALSLYERIVAINEKTYGVNSPEIIDSLNNLADFHKEKGDLMKALALYQRTLQILENQKQEPESDILQHLLIKSLSGMADIYVKQSQYEQALVVYKRILNLEVKDKTENYYFPAPIMIFITDENEYKRAVNMYLELVKITENKLGKNHPKLAYLLSGLADFYQQQGYYAEAIKNYQLSSSILEENRLTSDWLYLNNLTKIANIYAIQNNPELALAILKDLDLQKNLEMLKKNGSYELYLMTIGLIYKGQKNYEQAIFIFQLVLEMREKSFGSNDINYSFALMDLIDCYQLLGKFDESLPLIKKVMSIEENHNTRYPRLKSIESVFYMVRYFLGKSKKEEALHILNTNKDLIFQSYNLSGFAELFWEVGDYNIAIELFEKNLRSDFIWTWQQSLAENQLYLAQLHHAKGDYTQALSLYQKASDAEETLIARNIGIGNERYKRNFLDAFRSSTNAVVSFHLQVAPTNPEAARLALTTILRRKGRVLDTLSQNLSRLHQQLSPADQERLTRLSALRTQAAQIAFNPNPTDQQRQQFQLLNAQAEQIEAELNRSSSAFAQTTQKVTLEAVQKAIPANAALVEFIQYEPFNPKAPQGQRFGAPRYAVYVLTSTGEPRFADLGSASEIDALVAQYRSATLDPRRPLSEAQAAARTLSAKIMAPVRQLVGTANHLLIAPDGQLNLVSFAGLVDEKNQYLIETYQITYLTSGRDLLRLQETPPKANPPLIVANPTFDKPGSNPVQIASADRSNARSVDLATLKFGALPATAIEGETIAKLLPNSRLFTQAQATETVVKTSSNPRILHLATHGFFLKPAPTTKAKDGSRNLPNENPLLRSGLAFSGFNVRQGGGDDGVLTALEITGMDLRGTQLVVLSACETGLGDVQSGEGVYGLRRAFTLAGAQSQVMTLWRVDDEATKDLMVNYYQRLARGEGRGEALRQAQLAMLRSQNYAHPKYWSGMIPAGDWRGMSP